jgi:restriction system protein
MSRRYKQSSEFESFFENIADFASILPLYVTLPLAALLFYFVPFDLDSIQTSSQSNYAMIVVKIALFAIAKYLVPLALVSGAIVHIINLVKSRLLFGDIAKRGAYEVLSKMSWQDFEFLLSEWFKKQGYTTELTGGGGADGGIDIKLYKDGQLYLVQCKHYRASKVSVMVVRELYGVMTAENAAGGFVVTSGRFTSEAYVFAEKINIELIDKQALVKMLDAIDFQLPQSQAAAIVKCPKCGSDLVERKGKYGKFMGCSGYPKCDYTQSV